MDPAGASHISVPEPLSVVDQALLNAFSHLFVLPSLPTSAFCLNPSQRAPRAGTIFVLCIVCYTIDCEPCLGSLSAIAVQIITIMYLPAMVAFGGFVLLNSYGVSVQSWLCFSTG